MQQSTLLTSTVSIDGNDSQKAMLLANVVKEFIEGIITPGKYFTFAVMAIADRYRLNGISVVFDPDVTDYKVDGTNITFSANLETPTSTTYTTILEGIGAILDPTKKYRDDRRTVGMNWVNGYSTQLFSLYRDSTNQGTVLTRMANSFYTLLVSANPTVVDQYKDSSTFVADFVEAGTGAADVYTAWGNAAMKVLCDDEDASRYYNIYLTMMQTGGFGTVSSGTFMSAYLMSCLQSK